MPGKSPLGRISRLGTCHLKRVGGGFRVPFFDPTEGVLEFPFGDVFCMRGDPLRGKSDPLSPATAAPLLERGERISHLVWFSLWVTWRCCLWLRARGGDQRAQLRGMPSFACEQNLQSRKLNHFPKNAWSCPPPHIEPRQKLCAPRGTVR